MAMSLKTKKIFSILIDIAAVAVVCFAVIKIALNFSYSEYYVDGDSMDPTFIGQINVDGGTNYGTIDKTSYAKNHIERFDIVSTYYNFFSGDYSQPFEKGNSQKLDSASLKIKRVIGIPGDTVIVNNDYFSISFKDGDEVKKYEFTSENCPFARYGDANNGNRITTRVAQIELGEDEFFVMGDNWTAGASLDCCNTSSMIGSAKPLYKECIHGVITNIEGVCTAKEYYKCKDCGYKSNTSFSCPSCGSYNIDFVSEIVDKKPFDKKVSLKGLWQKYIGSLDI